ncbi:MAG: 16S rRNA (guanine(966)-N(2))-methyltransferase RsmD [bacterium]|jgi:16S rRNA (guanine966-N2)-methyltransferase
MRIIAGKYKNRNIVTPPGFTTRPMLSRIRKSVYGILDPYLPDAVVLDLFTGTGIEALEALSRGAAKVIGVEADRTALEVVRQNHKTICPDENLELLRGDVLLWIPRLAQQGLQFDIISVTPPYGTSLGNQTLDQIEQNPSLLREETVIFVQRDKREDIRLEREILEHVRTKEYGRTIFEFFMPYEKK